MCSRSHDRFKFWDLSDSISKTVQDRGIVAISGVARGGFGGSTPPLKNVKKISEDKIVEKAQRWSLHVLYRHQRTLFVETKVTYLLTH